VTDACDGDNPRTGKLETEMKNVTLHQCFRPRRQGGAVVLVVTLIMLLLVTVLGFVTARNLQFENRIAANELRARQALQVADAGIDYGLAFYQWHGVDMDGDGNPDSITTVTNLSADGSTVVLNAANVPSFTLTATPSVVAPTCDSCYDLVAIGESDDDLGLRRVSVVGAINPAGPFGPSNPVTTHAGVNLTGNATVENAYSDLTVRTGGAYDPTGSSALDNFTCNACAVRPGSAIGVGANNLPPELMSLVPNAEIYTTSGTSGRDVLDEDPNISNATRDVFFRNYLGSDPATIKNDADVVWDTANDADGQPSAADLLSWSGKLVWVDGDLSLAANSLVGCTDPSATASDVSTCDYNPANTAADDIEPVVLVVNGDLKSTGTATIFGLVYVIGKPDASGDPIWTTAGNFHVYGAVVVGGQMAGAGGFEVRYFPGALQGLPGSSRPVALAGTWRDF